MEALYASMDKETRIAVIGGGPSGLSAALSLVKLGYRNVTVLEQQSRVGGMCDSATVDGRVYDLGGQVIAKESSPTVASLMTEMGVELEELGERPMARIDCLTGKVEEMKIVADCVSMLPLTSKLQGKASHTGKMGVHAVSNLAHKPSSEYLSLHGFKKGVPPAVAALFIGSGYGYPEDMPYAYLHEFVRSSLGQPWRVKGGYSSFWKNVAALLPDVRCNAMVKSIQRTGENIRVSVVDCSGSGEVPHAAAAAALTLEAVPIKSSTSGAEERTLEFDKIIMSGNVSIPWGNRIYRSSETILMAEENAQSILDYTSEELDLLLKVETIDYYTTVVKISGLEHIPAMFYYPEHADDPANIGRFVTMQRFYADTDVFLFWSYGNAEIPQQRVMDLLYEDVERMGGKIQSLILQKKWRYFPHVRSQDMEAGFYDKLEKLQGKNNTYFTGALLAFELTERNSTFSSQLVNRYFGSTTEPLFVKRLVNYPLRNGAEEIQDYKPKELTELPGLTFPDLPNVDAYVSFYARHSATKDRVVYTWLDNHCKESSKLTFAQLDERVSVIAEHLLGGERGLALHPGDRVILVHPPGLEFIEAFLACLRARILAVPLIPPDPTGASGNQALVKLVNVAKITQAKAILSTKAYHTAIRASSISQVMKTRKVSWPALPWIHTNTIRVHTSKLAIGLDVAVESSWDLNGEEATQNSPDLNEVCFLQFTSGSTGDAKGVMITHGALIHNVKSMRAAYRSTSRSVVVSWLPQYHDMGLIGGLLVSLVTGGSLIVFSPLTFIRKPMIWLEMVEKYHATHTAAPNFGFELVLKRYEMLKSSGGVRKQLDLSSLHFLMVGAEPINSNTMREFVETFWDAGVREQIFAPGFGMAENCVFICCAFGRNRHMLVDWEGRISCGYTDRSRGTRGVRSGSNPHSKKQMDTFTDSCSDVRIVNPETMEEVGDAVEGEIWLSSPSNGVGYWEMREATQHTFCAHLKNASTDDAEIQFVRSGDLGRVIQGNLFVTGRIKDLIIVNGRNYYPSDIEKTIENCSPLVKPGCSAAFSAPATVLLSKGATIGSFTTEEAGIVVVVEVRNENRMHRDVANQLVSHIKAEVAKEHGLQVAFVNLIKPRSIPKTTSGKIRRQECLKKFSEGALSSIKGSTTLSATRARAQLFHQPEIFVSPALEKSSAQVCTNITKNKDAVIKFLVQLVSEITGLPQEQVNQATSFENYSIDSQQTVVAASKLSDFLGIHISAIQIYTTGCISELADFCDEQQDKALKVPSSGTNPPVSNNSSDACDQQSMAHIQNMNDITDEIDETQLANALEPSLRRQMGIAALQILGILYIGALLIMPGAYIYNKLDGIIAAGNNSLFSVIPLSITLVPLAWILYIATTALVLSTFGARVLLPLNNKSQTSAIFLWSTKYVRWWTLYRLIDFASNSLATYLRGTVFLTMWYRLLGAEIESKVQLDTVDITDPFLLSIGSGAVVEEGATIQCHEVNSGVVRFQRVTIGKECKVGPYAVVQRGSIMETMSTIAALSKTNVGERVMAEQTIRSQKVKSTKSSASFLAVMAVGQLAGIYLVGLISTISAVIAYMTFQQLVSHAEIITDDSLQTTITERARFGYLIFPLMMTFPRYLTIAAPLMMFPEPSLHMDLLIHVARRQKLSAVISSSAVAYVVYGVTLAILTCLLKWTLIGRLQGQTMESSNEGMKFRLWLVHSILRSAHEKFISMLMGTEALCIYLRSLGAQVAQMVSIRRLNAIVDPDLLNLGDECHLGDFSKIITSQNSPDGKVLFSEVTIGSKCVVGAQSVVMPGSTLEPQSVLGALSVAPAGAILERRGVYMGVKVPVKIYQQGSLSTEKPALNFGSKPLSTNSAPKKEELDHSLLANGASSLDPRFRQMIASVATEFVKNTPAGHSRYIHYLGSGGKGMMRVLNNLPIGFPSHDVLTPGATYPILLRCSNGVSKDDDRCTEVRGGTLRVLQPGSTNDFKESLLDLFLKTGDLFHARNMVEFLGYYIMTEAERAERIRQFPALGDSQWGNLRKPNSYAELHYFGCTTRYFETMPSTSSPTTETAKENGGGRMYVKFKIRPSNTRFGEDSGSVPRVEGLPPISGMFPPEVGDTRSKSFLRDDFKNRLESTEGVRFVLQLQLRPIPDSAKEQEEIQDPTKVWDQRLYPYMDVAELWLNEYVDESIFDGIHFNPKHGSRSLAMIPATSAMQAASIDQGRSIMHDLLGYMRSGTPLPPVWSELVSKSHTKAPPAAHARKNSKDLTREPREPPMLASRTVGVAMPPGCPMMTSQTGPATSPGCPLMAMKTDAGPTAAVIDFKQFIEAQKPTKVENKHPSVFTLTPKAQQSRNENYMIHSKFLEGTWDQIMKPSFLRCIQPFLQVITPMVLLIWAMYPSVLAMGVIGSKFGQHWMYGLLPVAYLSSGLTFTSLSIICKQILSQKIMTGHNQELWGLSTLRSTLWDITNQTLASTFLELGKGSALCTWYLQGLGASVKETRSVYIDTLHAMNPDHVKLGARSVIGRNALLFGHLYEGDKVIYKSNDIGDDTSIGTRALLLPGVRLQNGAQLGVLGLGMKDEVITFGF